MFSRLLVGLDGSPGADAALTAAIDLGRRFRSTILLAAIADLRELEATLAPVAAGPWTDAQPPFPELPGLSAAQAAHASALCEAAAARVSAAGLSLEILHASGLVDEELLRLAEQAEAVVVGRRGEMHAEPHTIGAVTARIVKKSPRPVVVAGESPSEFRKPLVAFDGGTTSTNALALAARYAEAAQVSLDVVHVGSDAADAEGLLARAGAFLSGERVAFSTHRLMGKLVGAVQEHIEATGADLLVVGAHGGRRRRSWSVGSQAESLIKATSVPVIVIR